MSVHFNPVAAQGPLQTIFLLLKLFLVAADSDSSARLAKADPAALDVALRWLGKNSDPISRLGSGKNDYIDLCSIPDGGNYTSLLLRTPRDSGKSEFYPPNKHCQTVIKASTPGSKLVVTFKPEKFYIENSEGCVRDYLIMEDAADSNHSVRCCGNRCENRTIDADFLFISQSGSLNLTFVSDHVIQKAGFMAQLAETIAPQCNGEPNMLATALQVTALQTNSSSDCLVTISGEKPDDVLRIDFQKFDLPYSGPNCVYDRLEFHYNIALENATYTKVMCGIKSMPEFIINANKVAVRFVNDLSRLSGIFSFRYYSISDRFWVTLREPYYYHIENQPLNISVHQMEPNQRCQSSFRLINDIVVTFYEFKFHTIAGRRLSARVLISPLDNSTEAKSSAGAMVYFSDRFICTTPSKLLSIQERYVYPVPLDPATQTGTIDTQSFEMMIYVATFGEILQKSVRLEVRTDGLDIYTGHMDLPISKDAKFSLSYATLLDYMDQISTQLQTSQMLIAAPRTQGVSDVYWNITSFELDSKYSDESCNKTGLYVVKRNTSMATGEKRFGPFCSASSLPVSILSQDSEVYFLLYYFHNLDVKDNDLQGGNVFTYSIGAYPCEMIDLSDFKDHIYLFYKKCLSIISEVQVNGKQNKTIEILGSEPLLVFTKFTSPNLMTLTEKQDSSTVTLTLMKKFSCESVVSIRRRSLNDRYYVEVTLRSDCDFCATFWTLHLETKCRARISYNDIATIGGPLQSIVNQECGIIESPGFPFPYEKYEKPIVWMFNHTNPTNVSSYYSFAFNVFDLDNCFNSFLTIMERVSTRFQTLCQCNRHSGSYLYTLSSRDIYIMFQANRITSNSKKKPVLPRFRGFSIRFQRLEKAAKPAPQACPVPGSEDWLLRSDSCYKLVKKAEPVSWNQANMDCRSAGGHLVSINSHEEMRDLMELILENKAWREALYSSDEIFVYIGLIATSDTLSSFDQKCISGRTSKNCWNWASGKNFSRNDFIWSNGEPLTYQEWYPSHNDSLFSKVPKNLHTVVQENLPQPNYNNVFLCVGMMMHNPRHHTNWVQVPCSMEIHGQSHICEKPANQTALLDKGRRQFNDQLTKMRGRTHECLDGWYQLDGHCYMVVSAASNVSILNESDAFDLCNRLNASIAHELNNTARLGAMIRAWKYTLHRGRIYVYSNRIPQKAYEYNGSSSEKKYDSSLIDEEIETIFVNVLETRNNFYSSDSSIRIDWTAIIPPRAALCWRPLLPIPKACQGHEFQCRDLTCISSDYMCNGKIDCPDGYDEVNCTAVLTTRFFRCANGHQVTWSLYCNYQRDCDDGSDEENCNFASCNPETEFKCEISQRCIPIEKRCDGVPMDCEFNQDELACNGECRGFQCRSASSHCLPRSLVNDTQVDCPGALMEDEDGSCLRNGDCLQNKRPWEFPDCDNALDERCMINHVKCFARREACMYNTAVGKKQACPNLEHLTECDAFECPGHFQCLSGGGYCVPSFRVCDGTADCPNAADEAACNGSFSIPYHFRCRGPDRFNGDIFVSRNRVCNGVSECLDGEDERFCDQVCPDGCYCIGYSVSCTGSQSTNEFNSKQISSQTRALILDGNRNVKLDQNFLSHLLYLGLMSIRSAQVSTLPAKMFASSANLVVLDLSNNQITTLHSESLLGLTNLIDLRLAGNPLTTIEPFAFKSLTAITHLPLQELNITELPEYALAGMQNLRALNLSNNPLKMLHELSFSNGSRWYSMIDMRVKESVLVHENTFACLERVDNFFSNSYKFCCLLEHAKTNCTPQDNDFNSCKDLLGRVGQRIAVWIYGVIAFVGNALVIGYRIYRHKVKTPSDFIIFNVSLADLLIALYLLSIGAVDGIYQDRYILYDDFWRQHPVCSLIGGAFIISSETSITFLALLSLERYLAIVNNLERSRRGLTMRKTVFASIGTWLVLLLFACLMLIRESKIGNAYSRTSACIPLITNNYDSWSITMLQYVFVAYNSVAFIVATVCYGRIFVHIRATRKNANRKAMEYDHLLARRLFVLVATNFLTWIPTIALYLCIAIGVQMPMPMITGFIIFVLPINPTLNPYLYTLSTMRMFCRETRRKIDQSKVLQTISSRVQPRHAMISSLSSYRRRRSTAQRGSASIETQTVGETQI